MPYCLGDCESWMELNVWDVEWEIRWWWWVNGCFQKEKKYAQRRQSDRKDKYCLRWKYLSPTVFLWLPRDRGKGLMIYLFLCLLERNWNLGVSHILEKCIYILPLIGIWYMPQIIENGHSNKNLSMNAHSSSMHKKQKVKTTQTPIKRWMNKQNLVYPYNGMLLSHKIMKFWHVPQYE